MNKLVPILASVAVLGCKPEVNRVEDKKLNTAEEFYLSHVQQCREYYDKFFEQEVCVRSKKQDLDVSNYYIPEIQDWKDDLDNVSQDMESNEIDQLRLTVLSTILAYTEQCTSRGGGSESECLELSCFSILRNFEPNIETGGPMNLFVYFYTLEYLITGRL